MPLLIVSLRPIRLSCTAASGIGQTDGPRAIAVYQPSINTTKLVSFQPIPPNCTLAFIFGRPPWPRCLYDYGLYALASRQPPALIDHTVLVVSLLIIIWPIRCNCPVFFGLYRPDGLCGVVACQPSAYTDDLHPSLRLRPTLRPTPASPRN